MFDRLGGLWQTRVDVHRPDVHCVLPRLERDIHPCGKCVVTDANCVVVENLVFTDLDEQRRQPTVSWARCGATCVAVA
jgi:hypothetical protein